MIYLFLGLGAMILTPIVSVVLILLGLGKATAVMELAEPEDDSE